MQGISSFRDVTLLMNVARAVIVSWRGMVWPCDIVRTWVNDLDDDTHKRSSRHLAQYAVAARQAREVHTSLFVDPKLLAAQLEERKFRKRSLGERALLLLAAVFGYLRDPPWSMLLMLGIRRWYSWLELNDE